MILLCVQAGAGQSSLQNLDRIESSRGYMPSCPVEDIFLCRLLQTESSQSSETNESVGYVKDALASRHTSALDLMKLLEDTIDSQRAKFEDIAQILLGKPSSEDALIQLRRLDDLITEEACQMRDVVCVLLSKHKQYADEIQTCIDNHSADQLQIKRLDGELDDSMAELEESRRKLINLKMQKDGVTGMRVPIPVPVIAPDIVNGTVSPEKPADRAKRLRELKESIEEIKSPSTLTPAPPLHPSSGITRHNVIGWKSLSIYQSQNVLYFITVRYSGKLNGENSSMAWHTAMILLNPCLILIDHGHFQYNCISLGLTTAAVAAILSDRDVLGSILFSLALNHKQKSAYYAPAFFGYQLGKCLRRKNPIVKVIKLGFVVLGTFAVVWWPYLYSINATLEVLSRLAPL